MSKTSVPKRPVRRPEATPTVTAESVEPQLVEALRLRVPLTFDPLASPAGVPLEKLTALRLEGMNKLHLGIQQLQKNLAGLHENLLQPKAPPQLIGVLTQPDGSPGSGLQMEFDPAFLGACVSTVVHTDSGGAFRLPWPRGKAWVGRALVGTDVSIGLIVRGGGHSGYVHLDLPANVIASNGLVGSLVLPVYVAPLPVSILAALQSIVPPTVASTPATPPPVAQVPAVKMGDCEDCLLSYQANLSVDRFPFGVFFRLVAPSTSVYSMLDRDGLPVYGKNGAQIESDGNARYVDRIPVEQPIGVDGFHDRLIGLRADGYFGSIDGLPIAATLGLGYVLTMAQRWTFRGLALGDLVYSLPLAPGEQQQVAIFERVDSAQVSESESLSQSEQQRQQTLADTSTAATVQSAFSEMINGSSSFKNAALSESSGVNLIVANGSGGTSVSTGTSSQSLSGQRDAAEQAAQATHSSAENQAAARRSAFRTGMRIATASESEQLTTKVVTNHNHTRALTMQYWEVQRLYDVTTAIDGLTLTVLIPLQPIRFMSPGQPLTLTDTSQVGSRPLAISRYTAIIKHADVLARVLPFQYRHGLAMLVQFAADPQATVDSIGNPAEYVIDFSLTGSFLACENVSVTALTDRGTRVGPARLTSNTLPDVSTATLADKEGLLGWLLNQRQTGRSEITGRLSLPATLSCASIVGFEITRQFQPLTYTLASSAAAALSEIANMTGLSTTEGLLKDLFGIQAPTPVQLAKQTISLSTTDLEKAIGGPTLSSFNAEIDGENNEQYANMNLSGVVLPPQPFPVPAAQLSPVLRYQDILEIERMAAHVVRNTLAYSRSIWESMSPDERAILLEAYTIGVPPGGVADASQDVPLLDCVENRVLGFFGNSMMMPFTIPEVLTNSATADGKPLDPAALHDALLAYHVGTFQPPQSTIALPTRGVLGEAVLGHCSSAEKIDLRRFWNWQDSPADTAPTIGPSSLPTDSASLAAGLSAPDALTKLTPIINNVLAAPSPDTSLLQALGQAATGQKDFDATLTGAAQLANLIQNAQTTANSARADALKTSKDLTAQAMATSANIWGAYLGHPDVGSQAAASVYGTGGVESKDSGSAPAANTKKPSDKTPTPTPPNKPKNGTSGGTGGSTGGGGTGGGTTPDPGGASTPGSDGNTPTGGTPPDALV